MAVAEIRPDWTVGTLTLVSGSKNFTTTGSALQTAAIQAGDEIITQSGLVLIIDTITGQNAGTLMENCPADAAGADQPLRIRFQPDGSRYNGATADLVQRLSNGNLYAFSELNGVADGVPVFTGAGTMDVVPKSEFGPTDTHQNLAELAALSKSNDQFIVMGSSGVIGKKPISDITDAIQNNATDIQDNATAISQKFTLPSGGTTGQFINGLGALAAMNKAAVGLGNVDNTSDANKPVSTAAQDALNLKVNKAGDVMTGNLTIQNSFLVSRLVNNIDDGFIWGIDNANLERTWSMYLSRFSTNESLGFASYNAGSFLANVLLLHKNGNVQVGGALSKGSGTFLIDHPLDPANKNLRHGFVEAPEYVNIYRGTVRLVDGKATVNIDDYHGMTRGTFDALNADIIVSSLQNNDGFSRVRPDGEVLNGVLRIVCEDSNCNDNISWMVTGRRQDAFVKNMDDNCESGTGKFIPEFNKED